MNKLFLSITVATLWLSACEKYQETEEVVQVPQGSSDDGAAAEPAKHEFEAYAPFALTANLDGLSVDQKQMLILLIEASTLMDELFWLQAYGDPAPLRRTLAGTDLEYFDINYGPWDRLDGDSAFLPGVGDKPLGAGFYPPDMSVEEFERADLPNKVDLYSVIRRDDTGALIRAPYHKVYATLLQEASTLLRRASDLAESDEFAAYLRLRAEALITDEYRASDLAWMDMKNNHIDLVIGAIETYEDRLFGYRAAYEAYVLIKDREWSDRLSRYASFLPGLQNELPVPAQYRTESPGTDSDLNAYDAIYYAGHSNAGSKTIAINLPNDEEVQLRKGTRRLQLKNVMRAKFDRILVPIAQELIDESQRKHVTFTAFFANTMFHEVAHGLGIKNTVAGKGTVRESLKDLASSLEEGKADVLGLYMITKLHEKGEIQEGELMDYYVSFLASIFRSIRFGASSAHGRANMVRFNYFQEMGGFSRHPDSGSYSVNFTEMQDAIDGLSARILRLQGDGDYEGAEALTEKLGIVTPRLQADLDRLKEAGIPVDIVFEQGVQVLGL